MYEVPLSMSLLGAKSSFQHAREKYKSKRAYVF